VTHYYFWLGDDAESLDSITAHASFHPPGSGKYQKEYTDDEERTRAD